MPFRHLPGLLILLLAGSPLASGAEKPSPIEDSAAVAFFESRIRPVLVKHCYDCHSAGGAQEGGLRLDTRRAIRAGGKRGPAVVPGKPESSWLLKAVSHTNANLKMPPKEKRLSKNVIADFTRWIKRGAVDPRDEIAGAKPPVRRAGRDFWAYQPVRVPKVPAVKADRWPRQTLDHFIAARLKENGLQPAPDAESLVLLRRLHFDLIGLPPSLSAMNAFQKHVREKGIDAAIAVEADRLLASPRFGEKWGRHWLDVARFGESSGGEANISFPYAWRYRDYVIDAFNADLPFNRFLTEQIAGDLLPFQTSAERARLLIATGYLAVGPKNLDEANGKQFAADLVDEQIDALSRGVMATSIACARCHDHKFDPFSMKDYYGLAGVFRSTNTFFGTAVSPANRVGGDPLPLPRDAGQKIFHRSIPVKRVAALKAQKAALLKEKRDKRAAQIKAALAGIDPSGIFTIRDALRIFWTTGRIEGQLEKVDDRGRALPLAMGTLDRDHPADARLFERGDVRKPSKTIPRAFPDVLRIGERISIPSGQSGRLELAQWLTHPRHPLTSRVIVNRVWRHLLGAGIVRTVDNFGATGERPSHPELLDHLATRFVGRGWSIKKLVREIVLSRTYRQSSRFNRKAFLKDPDNRLLWRVGKRRLEAEAIRDAMLAVSGELSTARPDASLVGRVIGDRPISLIGLDKRVPPDLDGSTHRSVYLPVIRDRLPDALELFDFAEPSLVTGNRETTNVPVQALYLMNSPFVQQRAAALAARLRREADSDRQRIVRAFELCYGRTADDRELKRCLAFLKRGNGNESVFTQFCQALLCTAEFRNLD